MFWFKSKQKRLREHHEYRFTGGIAKSAIDKSFFAVGNLLLLL